MNTRIPIRENDCEQMITICVKPIKCIKKDGPKMKIKHILMRHVTL